MPISPSANSVMLTTKNSSNPIRWSSHVVLFIEKISVLLFNSSSWHAFIRLPYILFLYKHDVVVMMCLVVRSFTHSQLAGLIRSHIELPYLSLKSKSPFYTSGTLSWNCSVMKGRGRVVEHQPVNIWTFSHLEAEQNDFNTKWTRLRHRVQQCDDRSMQEMRFR